MWVEMLMGGSVLGERGSEDREGALVKGLGEWKGETILRQSWSVNEEKGGA